MQIDAHTQLNLVIGNPVRHSLSPALHQKIYQSLGMNAVMLACENPNLSDLISTIKTMNIRLTAVTLPFKTEIIEYADILSEEVTALSAANTLILNHGKIYAHNTDVDGIRAALVDIDLTGKKVLILGAGGAARAAAYALRDTTLFYLNRTIEKAEMLAAQFGGEVIGENDLKALSIDIIINATSVGMQANLSPLPYYEFNSNQIVFDMVYQDTQLLKDAKKLGAKTISGIIMFEHQALKQIELLRAVIT